MYKKHNVGWNNFLKELTFLLLAIIIGFVSTLYINAANNDSVEDIQKGLASSLIRFHVIANSDSEHDQNLKIKVRDAVLEDMKKLFDSSGSIEETREIIKDNIEEIQSIAEKVIEENKEDYDIKVYLEEAKFPTKVYGDIVLPTGDYEALRIEIGDGKGENWWCVMFPPLCFVDVTHGVVPEDSKDDLKEVLSEEEYKTIISARSQNDIPVKVKFKLVEVINEKNERQEKKKTGILTYLFGWMN
ncbi:MAG: stage II sporulation protein R [Eubacteriales bacterium]